MGRCEAGKKCPDEFVSFTPGGELLQTRMIVAGEAGCVGNFTKKFR